MSVVMNGTDEEVNALSCQDLEDDYITHIKTGGDIDPIVEQILRSAFKNGATVVALKMSSSKPSDIADVLTYLF